MLMNKKPSWYTESTYIKEIAQAGVTRKSITDVLFSYKCDSSQLHDIIPIINGNNTPIYMLIFLDVINDLMNRFDSKSFTFKGIKYGNRRGNTYNTKILIENLIEVVSLLNDIDFIDYLDNHIQECNDSATVSSIKEHLYLLIEMVCSEFVVFKLPAIEVRFFSSVVSEMIEYFDSYDSDNNESFIIDRLILDKNLYTRNDIDTKLRGVFKIVSKFNESVLSNNRCICRTCMYIINRYYDCI